MIEVTNHELHTNTAHVQAQADKEPVLISGNAKKQILLNYDDYLRLAKKEEQPKPFVSAYEAFVDMLSDYTDEELQALVSDNIEFDMSFLEQQ